MRELRFLYKTNYEKSRALIIGINNYKEASPLAYAVNDATEMRDILIDEFGFPKENVTCLIDGEATRQGIMSAIARLSREDIGADDRILIFFAGHGDTLTGNRGEIGFLIPHDASLSDYSTFIRWDELTKNAEMIRAKHVLFIMDACYGGLALTRKTLPGSSRFLKDMLRRHSRQVLTAGKANETVADAGGPLEGHSIFTGHLIEALRGKAASNDGVLTASGVMAYVYQRVSSDGESNQTPHYGHLDGDGDFIFKVPEIMETGADETKDLDRLIVIPYSEELHRPEQLSSKTDRLKLMLAENKSSIQLHDFLVAETRHVLAATSAENFPLTSQFTLEEFISRLERYEEATIQLSILFAAASYWATSTHLPTLQKCFSRHCDPFEQVGGTVAWLGLRWYPLILHVYHAGIAAVDAKNYNSLAAIFLAPTQISHRYGKSSVLVEALGRSISENDIPELWKSVPGHQRQYTPMSEYLFKIIQPKIDDLLFIGKNYESAFDTFEILFALSVADLKILKEETAWGPVGRFGWKRRSSMPFNALIEEAREEGDAWGPLKAGLFGGKLARFERVATEYDRLLAQLHWH